jgi:hypothetical protein
VRGSQGLRGNDNAGHPLANFSGTSARIPEFRQFRGILSERPCTVPEIPEFRGDASRRPFRNSAGTPEKVAVLMEGPLRTLPTLPTLRTLPYRTYRTYPTYPTYRTHPTYPTPRPQGAGSHAERRAPAVARRLYRLRPSRRCDLARVRTSYSSRRGSLQPPGTRTAFVPAPVGSLAATSNHCLRKKLACKGVLRGRVPSLSYTS